MTLLKKKQKSILIITLIKPIHFPFRYIKFQRNFLFNITFSIITDIVAVVVSVFALSV